MRLSLGRVEGERLTCPYHGWSYDPEGDGRVPSTPQLRVCATHYDVAEKYGAIWVKSAGSSAKLPEFGGPDQWQIYYLRYLFQAPLELALDNFSEVEHSAATHRYLAYDKAGIAQTEVNFDIRDDIVRIANVGPQRAVFEPFRWFMNYEKEDLFVGEAVIHFSPVYVDLNTYFLDRNRVTRRAGLGGAVVFNPISEQATELHLFGFSARGRNPVARLALKAMLTSAIHMETMLDKRAVERIADKNPDLDGMKLSRFDRPLAATRERLRRLYWGQGDVIEPSRLTTGAAGHGEAHAEGC